jgi:2-polyprenyl-6-methoxyphenol hydroxylase-like FAD-dependent oxidoreductase
MARIIVAGGGICGSAAALMLARDGHDVTVLERDGGPVPASIEAAWDEWDRRSVAQFRFAHVMLARGHSVLARELPDVVDRLAANGGLHYNPVDVMLNEIPGATRLPDDDRFDSVTGRRSSIEWALATTLADEPNITVRRGSAVMGLVAGNSAIPGVPHVAGVRLADGEIVSADLVIDATGRRSPTIDWIAELGGQAPIEAAEDSGFMYIGRFYRSADGSTPQFRAPVLTPLGSISILCIASDNGTWATTLYAASSDAPMRRLRSPEVFDRVISECPLHAHWIDGEPISELSSMSGVVDRTRRFVVDDVPVVTGMLSIADAHACTNPSIGRGMTLGLMHTVVMRDAVRTYIESPVELAKAFDQATAAEIDPWHAATRDLDRRRIALMEAAVEGREPELDPAEKIGAALLAATRFDEQAARWFGEIQGCLAFPMDVLSRDGAIDHILFVTGGEVPKPIPGPDRQRLLELVSQ